MPCHARTTERLTVDYIDHEEIHVPSLCPLNHNCVVCGVLTLETNRHGVRGALDADQCAEYFNVRCSGCSRAKKLPDGTFYKAWFELNEIETISHRAGDGRKIFFEVM